MTEVHAAFGAYREMIPLAHGDGFQLVRATSEDGELVLALLPGSVARARLELSHARRIAGPAVVVPTPGRGPGAVALVELPGLEDSAPLAEGSELPPAALRHGLVVLLSALSQAHARGLLHGRVGSATILAGPSGEFHLIGWADAVDVEDETVDLSRITASVSGDIEGVARALLPLLQAATRAHHASPASAAMGVVEGVALVPEHGITRDFTRVLSRMLSQDPREVYAGAAEALEDLGEHDLSIHDGELPVDWPTAVDVTGIVRHVIREAVRDDDETQYEAVVEVVGPSGSGRTDTLRRVASAIRADGGLVLHISGSDPGPWGPFTTLTRRLLNLVPPDAEPLREFDVEIATLLGEPCEAGDVAGVIGAVAAALGELLEVVFQRDLGVVLLDDAGQLGAASRQVWQSIVRWRHRRHIEGKGLPLAFVATSEGPAAPEIGLPTRVVELAPIARAALGKELGNVLWEPDLASDLADYLHAATEGWPRSLQACWADLVRRGVLQRNEGRYHLHRSLDAAPGWSEAIVRTLGQTYAEHGHQVRRFLEVLAASGRRPLDRRLCATLSELSGPTLWRAAEAVEATDLVERVGTAWRLPSQSVRARVYSAIPLERRRALHRELLAHYERSDEPDLNAQAEHARAGSHPKAADLTERAVRECLATGHLTEAVQHVRDLERHADSVGHRPDLWILAAEVLGSAGAVTEALRVTDRAMASNRLSVREELEVKLLCARLELTFDRPENVISIDVPYCPGAEEQICALRWFRAAALVTLGDLPRASREARLAAAELEAPTKNPLVRFAEARYEAQRGRTERKWVLAYKSQLRALRSARLLMDRCLYAASLARMAQLHRLLAKDTKLAVLRRCESVLRRYRLEYSPAYLRWAAERPLIKSTVRPPLPGYTRVDYAREVAIATVCAERIGSKHLAPFFLFKEAETHARLIGPPPSRVRRLVFASDPPSVWAEFTFSVTAANAMQVWMYYGHFQKMAELHDRLKSQPAVPNTNRSLWLFLAYREYVAPRPDWELVRELTHRICTGYAGGRIARQERSALPWLVAAAVMHNRLDERTEWPLMRLVWVMHLGHDAWGQSCLALAILLWWRKPIHRRIYQYLLLHVDRYVRPLPAALEWQRLLVRARHAMHLGDPIRSLELRARARRELERGAASVHAGLAELCRRNLAEFRGEMGIPNAEPRTALPRSVERESSRWLNECVARVQERTVRYWVHTVSDAVVRHIARRLMALGLDVALSIVEGRSRSVDVVCAQPGDSLAGLPDMVTVLTTDPYCTMDVRSRDFVSYASLYGSYASACAKDAMRSRGERPCWGREVVEWLESYRWPGGPAEASTLIAAMAKESEPSVSRIHELIDGSRGLGAACQVRRREARVVRALYGEVTGVAVAALARRTALPRRSLQRTLAALTARGVLARSGRASTTTYLLDHGCELAKQMSGRDRPRKRV